LVEWFDAPPRRERVFAVALAVVGAVTMNWPVFTEPWDPRAVTYQNVGLRLLEMNDHDRAGDQFRGVLELVPAQSDLAATAHRKLAAALHGQNCDAEAIEHCQLALAIRPDRTDWHTALADLYAHSGRTGDAVREWLIILRVEPENADVHYKLAHALARAGRWEAAAAHYRQLVRLRPAAPQALNRLAWILATHPDPNLRAPAEALDLARRANDLTQNDSPLVLATLAAAQAATGDFGAAVSTAKRAIDMARTRGETRLAEFTGGQLQCYEQGEAYVMPTSPDSTR